MQRRSRILVAAPMAVIGEVAAALSDDFSFIGAPTLDQALARLNAEEPDLIILCYAFDEMRPYRLLNYLQERRSKIPIVLVRALPVPLHGKEDEIRSSYAMLGAGTFINLYEEIQSYGRTVALQRFLASLESRMRRWVPG